MTCAEKQCVKNAERLPDQFYDMDYVLHNDGRIFIVLGNFMMADTEGNKTFLAYNVYSPDDQGDRTFRGKKYVRNYTEDRTLPRDVFDTQEIVKYKDIAEHYDPMRTALTLNETLSGTVWAQLYNKLTEIFGVNSVGVFGSALPGCGLHLTSQGVLKNDVDFFIEGLHQIDKLKEHIAEIKKSLGINDYSQASQQYLIQAWSRVLRNSNNTVEEIMKRRWCGMEITLDGKSIRNTIKFRDIHVLTPSELLDNRNIVKRNVCVSGVASQTITSNLFPRIFTIESGECSYFAYSFWWKICSPVKEGDKVRVCGDIFDVKGEKVLRLSNYEDHWIQHI